ncbi:1-deoxy-D-xylulose-5-phosphate synthase [Marinobacterium sp. xm-a-121]|uniref:transketolase family protein n=1 Tax=unclassified Marinobacterium TaxID=2644139 RepID=UPI0015683404|nr:MULTISPECIES: transketolase C-terminal domain-containing protein [unclassified Marinobacterium]NRP37537.1 1-deoxy-D-xylulose-5-phosphate synthase [Marinobacterium sp. xm-a-121]NRP99881.1 1-deoxy-D-xylulose-5-phosphate synthase [Marinobacterium sp. xm-v-233]
MEINRKVARRWSKMGPRAVYGKVMTDIALGNEDVLLVSADLGRSSGLSNFYQAHPERFVNTGIAEQNMVGVAAGLTRTNFKVYASTFAPFASMRAAEQVRMNMGYMHEPVKLVALGSGVAMAFLGNSHFGLEDLAVMRAIPDLTIICPADCIELYKVLHATLDYDHPVYIRLTGAVNCPVIYEEDYEFEIGKPNWILPKGDINVFACGSTVGQAKKAIEKLNEEQGLSIGLLNFHTLKPIDNDWLAEQIYGTKKLFIFEEHTAVGGLRSLLFDFMIEYNFRTHVVAHTLPDAYLESGEYDYLIGLYGLDAAGIEKKISENL